MKSNVFIARLARGAATTAVAGAFMAPQNRTEAAAAPPMAQEVVCANRAGIAEVATRSGADETFVLTMTQTPSVWDKKVEREFRKLALEEAKGTIGTTEAVRLEELNRLRNQLLNPPSSDEIRLQLKRDRLLSRMESLLKEYVEFQEATNQKRATA